MAITNPTSIVATQNLAKGWVFNFKDSNGTPINVVNFTFVGGFMTQRGKPVLGYFQINEAESDRANGKVVFELPSGWSDAAGLSVSKPERLLEFQIVVIDPSTSQLNIYGYFNVMRSSL